MHAPTNLFCLSGCPCCEEKIFNTDLEADAQVFKLTVMYFPIHLSIWIYTLTSKLDARKTLYILTTTSWVFLLCMLNFNINDRREFVILQLLSTTWNTIYFWKKYQMLVFSESTFLIIIDHNNYSFEKIFFAPEWDRTWDSLD